jgi:asparagine synthase (glutamine-hydrolysing)
MCGIAGIVCPEGVNAGDLRRMSASLRHRGPDDEGFLLAGESVQAYRGDDTVQELSSLTHLDQAASATLGLVHRRLSIIDLEASGHQPMQHQEYWLVYNGEIYNYRELREELARDGVAFKTGSDSEVLLAAYAKWGSACVQHFIGMWAFALYDRVRNCLFISRDRFGIKPLYYHFSKGKFAFASEIKALLQLSFVSPCAKLKPLLEYISFGATSLPSGNLFSEIETLPPGHNLVFDLAAFEVKAEQYYDLGQQVRAYQVPANAQESFSALLQHSVDIHLRADVSVGSTLSGGLDSSTLVALAAARVPQRKFKTFTASYRESAIDESAYARRVTDRLPNADPHYAYPSIDRYWEDLEKITWHQDLPISSTSMYAQWEVMKLARKEQTKVLLDGQGADEILGGYYNFAGLHLIELLKRGKLRAFFLEKQALKGNFAPNINSTIGRAFFYFLPEGLQRRIRAKKRLGMGFVSTVFAGELASVKVPERGGRSFREQSMLSMQYGLQDLLRYEDRNSMAFSIESRVPFLDHRIVEFCIALQNEWKIKDGWTKYILRKAAEPHLDRAVTWRRDKMGFLTPQKSWLEHSRNELRSFLGDAQLPPFLNKEELLRVARSGLNESAHLSEFWRVISFIKWWQVFNVKLKDE